MRKQTKKVLSIVMSAALAITAGAGINLTKSSAADTKPNFKAALWSFGTFADWKGSASDTVQVTDFGEYTLTGEATKNLDDLFKSDNGTAVVLGDSKDYSAAVAETGIDNFEVVGKSIQINDGDIIPWNVTPSDWEGARMVIHNAWSADIDFKTDKVAPIKTGDKIKVTFEVKAKDGSSDVTTPGAITTPGAVETPVPEKKVPTDADLVGTAQLDSQANGWCGNDDCTNVKADIKGAGTYTVSSTWEEVQEDPQAYCAMTIADLKPIADYVTFSNVTVWIDGKVVDIPVIYGGDKDCRIQLWNTWGNDGVGDGFAVPANFPKSFYEIKVQFTIGLRDTARDWDAESKDSSLISIDKTQSDYEPANKPAEPTPADPTPAPTTPSTKNSVKTLKAAKKSVNVKKGKKANVTVKVTANNNKKKTTDKVTATSSNKKVAKVVKTTVKAGKIVVSVKGVKKGTAKITVKAAKKKAVVTVKVK